jgi:hypothetical protein
MATVRLQLRRGEADQWVAANPTLAPGEIGIETDTNTFKFGDGSTPWNSLSYALSQTVDDYILLSTKGVANGVASLDSSGFIPSAQLPPLAKVTVSSAANQAARLALTAEPGDIAIQSDNGTTYVLASSPASTNGNWREISATAAISAAIATHEADTTSVHGIADTSLLATTANVATAKSEAISAAATAAGTALSTHEADTTSVHGIADTSLLATTANVATAKSEAISAAATAAGTALSTHDVDTTGVHGIADTAELATKTYANSAVTTAVSALTKSSVGLSNVDNTSDLSKPVSSATLTALDLKAPLSSPALTGDATAVNLTLSGNLTVNGTTSTINSTTLTVQDKDIVLGQTSSPTDAAADNGGIILKGTTDKSIKYSVAKSAWDVSENINIPADKSIKINNIEVLTLTTIFGKSLPDVVVGTTETQNLTNKTLNSPIINTPTGITKSDVGLSNVDNTADSAKPVSTAAQSALDLKAPLASPTFTGTVTLPVGTVTSGMIADGSIMNADINAAAEIATSKIAGLDTALGLKAPLASPTFTGTVTLPAGTVTSGMIADGAILDSDISGAAAIATSKISGLDTALDLKAPLASPTFTGTVSGITKSMVGLGSVDNTTDAEKPVSTAAQSALDLKAPLASPTFTGTVSGITKAMVGLTNANDTSDLAKPISTATQAALDLKAPLNSPTFTGTVVLPSTTSIGLVDLSELGYVNGVTSSIQTQIDSKAPLASPTFTGTVTLPSGTVTSGMIADGAVATADVADLAISTGKIADAAVTTAKIADDSITSAKIVSGTIVNSDINASAAIDWTKLAISSTVDSTEIGYVNGVTSAIQTQLTAGVTALSTHEADTTNIHGIADTSLLVTTTGTQTLTNKTITSPSGLVKADVGLANVDNTADSAKPVSTAQATAIATAKAEAISDATSQVNALLSGAPAALNTLDELAAALGDDANFAASVTTSLGLKVDSLTPISQKTASYTLSSLTERDDLIEMGSASPITLTIPTDATLNYPIGTSIDILQTGAGQVTIAPVSGTVTVNATPGLKLRTTWSSATLLKRAANTWVVFGDLTA